MRSTETFCIRVPTGLDSVQRVRMQAARTKESMATYTIQRGHPLAGASRKYAFQTPTTFVAPEVCLEMISVLRKDLRASR